MAPLWPSALKAVGSCHGLTDSRSLPDPYSPATRLRLLLAAALEALAAAQATAHPLQDAAADQSDRPADHLGQYQPHQVTGAA